MPDDRLRLLALWHARRREVDELLEPLLLHGPAAVARVSAQLATVTLALDAERSAFEAFAAAGAVAVAEPGDEVTAARDRSASASREARRYVHPSTAEVLERTGVVVQLAPRRPPDD